MARKLLRWPLFAPLGLAGLFLLERVSLEQTDAFAVNKNFVNNPATAPAELRQD